MQKIILPLTVLLVVLFACQPEPQKTVTTELGFSKYVQSFTSGIVSKESLVSIYLTQAIEGDITTGELFRFTPEIKGETVFLNNRTIEFRPGQALKSGTTYTVEFNLGKLFDTEKEFEKMPFQFSTVKQSFSVNIEGLKNYETVGSTQMQLTGYVLTADVSDVKNTEQIVSAKYEGENLPITWTHDSNQRKHYFTVDSISRHQAKAGELTVAWDGEAIGVKNKGVKKIEVPALNAFNIIECNVVQQPEQCIHIRFSDPLLKTQDLKGLIELDSDASLRLEIEGNSIKAWTSKQISGTKTLNVFEGIKSSNYIDLKETQKFLLQFTNAEPQVRLIGNGVIVPQSNSLEFPFEAVSLNAVDVRIIQVYEDNITQFFQDNNFNGSSGLRRVGRMVFEGKVELQGAEMVNLNEWNTFKINLADYITIEQGAIYRVQLRFKKAYSLYNCPEKEIEELNNEIVLYQDEDYVTEWDLPGWYSDSFYPDGYEWRERDNPCHVSYYNYSRFESRNIFASQLGITAKEGRNHKMLFAVSNLLTTDPESGVEIQLLNYQNQVIETLQTDSRGFAEVDMKKKPYLLVAKKGKQFGYLRLDDGTALSVSNFDVSGQQIQEGMKGFIYGERDVWRPGDTLFLNFILDTEFELEKNHPLIFSLINPKSQILEKRVVAKNENGFYSLTTKTESDAPTGNWTANVKVGNTTFSKRLKIESIKPNRLKIELGLPSDKLISKNNKLLSMKALWLQGTPAKSLKAKVEVRFAKSKTEFENYKNFTFNDPAVRFIHNEETIFDANLNEKGEGTIPLNFSGLNNAPGMLNAWFTSRVFETGGDFSTSISKATYSPYNSYVGVRMLDSEDNWYKTDTEYSPEIVLVDKNGKPVSGHKIEARLYKINWRWWWESGDENLANYVSGTHFKPVTKWIINSAPHKSKIKLKVKYRNWQDNGRYFLWVKDQTSGHSTGLKFYMSKWGGWRSDGMSEGATMLSVRTDKKKYNVGDDINVTFPSSKTGKALVSLENGTGVLDMFWVETTDKQTQFTVKSQAEMAPNFYVNVSLIQAYGQTENDAPLRLYGLTPVFIENPETILKPQIKAPDEIEPEANYTVEVSEANDKKMTYTLAIVDEGLLGLTNYKAPNPHHSMYRREALGVKTWDLYDNVAGAYGARLEKAFAIGGDDEGVELEKKEANRFKPVVQFAGPFTLEAGKKQKHSFTMPNYVGAVRMMVIAGYKGAYGSKEISVPVRKGLMLLATVPRILAPREEFQLPVNVFAMKENVKNVKVSVHTNDLIEVVGNTHSTIQFAEMGEQMAYFKLKVKGESGIAKIYVEAQSGKEKASYEVEVDVRNPNLPLTIQQEKMVNGKSKWNTELHCPGKESTNEAWIEISGFPPLNLSKHLDYLIHYPHGCIEQVTSSVFPQLFLENLTEVSADQKMEIEDNVRSALQKLLAFQVSNGGFAYWPGGSSVNEWGTNYVGHFILNAEKAGYSLPFGLKDKWLKFQKSAARNWKMSQNKDLYSVRNNDFVQAYRLYTLALSGNPDMGAMNRLREIKDISLSTRWRLAAAYLLAGKHEAASQLISGASKEVKVYNELGGTFGSSLRDKAMVLETLVLLNDKDNAFKILQNISEDINACDWLSTQTASWCLVSAAKFSAEYFKGESETRFELTANGETIKTIAQLPVVRIPVKIGGDNKVSIQYENKGENASFVRVVAKGIPIGIDSSSAEENLFMNVKYLDSENKTIDPRAIKQGTDFRMEVTVLHPGKRVNYEEMVLSTLFPSGWEIINKRVGGVPRNTANYEYQDIRDDRIYTYFDLNVNEQKVFTFYLNAAYKGKYYHPPVSCEAMYDNSVRSHKAGKIIEVQ